MFKFFDSDRADAERQYQDKIKMPRRRGFLPIIDGYVLREFMTKFSVLILVFAIAFIIGDVFHDLGDFLSRGASPGEILAFLALKLPGNIRFVLPMTMLLGCIWTMASFGKNQEVTAMRASGISLFRCGGAIFFVGLIITLVNIYFNEIVVPRTDHMAQVVYDKAMGNQNTHDRQMLAYRSSDGHRSWYFTAFSPGYGGEKVLLKVYNQIGDLDYDLVAERAQFDQKKGWSFFNGAQTTYLGQLRGDKQDFERFDLALEMAPETPWIIDNSLKDEEELPSWVILEILSSQERMSERAKDIYWTVFFYRLAFPWACFLAVFLGVPLATKGERSGIMIAIISSIGMIVGYIICAQVFMLLGKRGIVPPLIAGIAPTVGFIIYGYYKVVKTRN